MFTKLIRLGKDSEMGTTGSGKQVLNFVGAYDIGYGDNKKTQWVECSLWGDRGQKVAQYLLKGSQIVVTLDDLHSDAYTGKNGIGSKLKGRVVSFDFAGEKPQQSQAPQQQYQQQRPQQQPQQQPAPTGFDDFDEDIPFSNYELKVLI